MTTEQTYAGYSADELRRMIQRGIPPTDVPMTGEMWQDYIAMYDAATAIPALLDRIAALEAEAAPLRELWAAVEGLEHRMRTDKEDVFHVRVALSHKQPGQISAALVGRVGEGKKHMGAIDEVREPTLAAALIALGEPAP